MLLEVQAYQIYLNVRFVIIVRKFIFICFKGILLLRFPILLFIYCDLLKYGNILKLEIIDYIFRKIITLNEVNISESPNECN